jgi:hypothetical protein
VRGCADPLMNGVLCAAVAFCCCPTPDCCWCAESSVVQCLTDLSNPECVDRAEQRQLVKFAGVALCRIALAVSNKHWCMIAEYVAHMSMNVLTDMITALVRPGQEVCEEAADPSEVQSNRQISCHPWCQCPRCRFAIYQWSPNLHATRIFITTVHQG